MLPLQSLPRQSDSPPSSSIQRLPTVFLTSYSLKQAITQLIGLPRGDIFKFRLIGDAISDEASTDVGLIQESLDKTEKTTALESLPAEAKDVCKLHNADRCYLYV